MSSKKKAVKKVKQYGIFFYLVPESKLDLRRSEEYPKTYPTKAAAQEALRGDNNRLVGRFVKALEC